MKNVRIRRSTECGCDRCRRKISEMSEPLSNSIGDMVINAPTYTDTVSVADLTVVNTDSDQKPETQ